MADHGDPTTGNKESDHSVTARQAYNIVSDTVTGVNIRVKDNVIQAIVIVVCLALGALVGAIIVEERLTGALIGGFIGLLVGFFGSGIYLMIYRAVMHARGRHD